MLKKTVQNRPLALHELVRQGVDIGIDTSEDIICNLCWNMVQYRIIGTEPCPIHGVVKGLPEWVTESNKKFSGYYESKLIERLNNGTD
jgi:hypothetical protein